MKLKTFAIAALIASLLLAFFDSRQTTRAQMKSRISVEKEADVLFENLVANLNERISRQQLPQATMQPNGKFTVISYHSKLLSVYGITCAEMYWNVPYSDVHLPVQWHINENPFVQVIAQQNGEYITIRLRQNCIEQEVKQWTLLKLSNN